MDSSTKPTKLPSLQPAAKVAGELQQSRCWLIAQEALTEKRWSDALAAISALDAEAVRLRRSLASVANRVNRRHWSPLLEDGND